MIISKTHKKIKTQLVEQRSEIINKTMELKKMQTINDLEQRSDEGEAARKDMEDNLSFFLHERDRSVLMKIEKALAKIEDGSYGECESCGVNISVKRLSARPFAELCIDCQEEKESKLGTHIQH